jgi:hypothetical protein
MDLVNSFSQSISDKLNNGYDKSKFDEILIDLKTVADNLKKDD